MKSHKKGQLRMKKTSNNASTPPNSWSKLTKTIVAVATTVIVAMLLAIYMLAEGYNYSLENDMSLSSYIAIYLPFSLITSIALLSDKNISLPKLGIIGGIYSLGAFYLIFASGLTTPNAFLLGAIFFNPMVVWMVMKLACFMSNEKPSPRTCIAANAVSKLLNLLTIVFMYSLHLHSLDNLSNLSFAFWLISASLFVLNIVVGLFILLGDIKRSRLRTVEGISYVALAIVFSAIYYIAIFEVQPS
jgi:hypothetical protein